MDKLILVLFCLLFSSKALLSCSCYGGDTFCQELADTSYSNLYPKYVIRATKLEDFMHGMIVKIEKQYINEIEKETIIVWGDPGHLCRVNTNIFDNGDQMILSINKSIEEGLIPGESIDDFWISSCSKTYLKVENGMVNGPILTDVTSMPVLEFECYLYNEEYLLSCSSTNISNPSVDNIEIYIYPNPTSNFATIDFENNECVPNLKVYNSIGQVQQVNITLNPMTGTLDLSKLVDGIYFLKIKILKQEFIRKIIVNRT